MPKNTPPQSKPAQSQNVIRSLADLRREVSQTIQIQLELGGPEASEKIVVIEARRLTPAESSAVDEILGAIVPPIIKGKTMEEDRPDYTNDDFRKARSKAQIASRSLALYWTIPAFKMEGDEAPTQEQIIKHVQGLLNSDLLDLLYQAVRGSGVRTASLVNFS